MNILMVTNTFTPHVGGVARSVQRFTDEYRRRGHRVVVVAPVFEGVEPQERDVLRFPAVQQFNGSDFSVPVPFPGLVAGALGRFTPEIVHSHHPILLGDTALRLGASRGIPVVFTHHTLYEEYTHYVPGNAPWLKRAAIELATGYCNLCDAVIAPSQTIAALLLARGVRVPIRVIPTGVDFPFFARGEGALVRRQLGIPPEAFVVGHVGRLAPEKNLRFLAEAVATFLRRRPGAHFLVAGVGPSQGEIRAALHEQGVAERLHLLGVLESDALANVYRAMDVFAFASHTETQGMVLTEAMAAGVPVVAVDAPGVREVVRDGENGRLLFRDDQREFAAALEWVASLAPEARRWLPERVARTAEAFSMDRTATRALTLYEWVIARGARRKIIDQSAWSAARRRLAEEWRILRNIAVAASGVLR